MYVYTYTLFVCVVYSTGVHFYSAKQYCIYYNNDVV